MERNNDLSIWKLRRSVRAKGAGHTSMKERKYNLLTAVAMIAGIVIGSGIFFKSDNVLAFTGGNVVDGVIVFCVAAVAIIFGSLTLAQLALLSDEPGGLIAYANEFSSPRLACALGWFDSFLYYPTLIVVVAWVSGIYACSLFGWESTLTNQMLFGGAAMLVLWVMNVLSARLGGQFQNLSLIIKLIPLVGIALAGLFFGDVPAAVSAHTTSVGAAGLFAAIVPIAFSFDGWIVATSIGGEIKDAKKNLPRAMILSPILILVIYVAYFVGVCSLVGPDQVLALGDAHVEVAATKLVGALGAKLIIIFVIVSVLGTVNGLILGGIRLPYAMGMRGMMPGGAAMTRENKKIGMPLASPLVILGGMVFWWVIHFLTSRFDLLPGSDISEIAIVVHYILYVPLYIAVIKLAKKGRVSNKFYGYACPVLACVGSLIVLIGGFQSKLFPVYLVICALLIGAAVVFYNKHKSQIVKPEK